MAREPNPPAHPVPPDTRTLPLREEISKQAEKLWEKYGRPKERDDAIWLEAERQLLGADSQANQQAGGAVPAAPLGDVFYPPVQPRTRTESKDSSSVDSGSADHPSDGAKLPPPGADTGLPK